MKNLRSFNTWLILFILALLAGSLKSSGQKLKSFNKASHLGVQKYYRGDTVLINCDTVMLLNQLTFNVYNSYYNKKESSISNLKMITNGYNEIIRQKDAMYANNDNYYRLLKMHFDSVAAHSQALVQTANAELSTVKLNLTNATGQLNQAQAGLANTQKLLMDERQRQNLKALKFGLGGVAAGALIALIISH